MSEKVLTPFNARTEERKETEEGLEDFLRSPCSGESVIHPELIDCFSVIRAERPLEREDIEQDVEDFVDQNLEALLPIFLSSNDSHSDIIKALDLTNEHIGSLGVNYYIQEVGSQATLLKSNEYNTDGYSGSYYEIGTSDFIALAYAQKNIRVDSLRASGRTVDSPPISLLPRISK